MKTESYMNAVSWFFQEGYKLFIYAYLMLRNETIYSRAKLTRLTNSEQFMIQIILRLNKKLLSSKIALLTWYN